MKYWPKRALLTLVKPFILGVLASAWLMAPGGAVAQQATPPSGVNIPPANNTSNTNTSHEAAFRRVSNRLLCQCGCSYMVLSCNHLDCSSATYIRRTIQTSLAAGKSEDAIVAGFVEQYGPRILPEPPKKGFAWSAWIMPFVFLLLGVAVVSYVLWIWKSKYQTAEAGASAASTPNPTAPADSTPALVEKYRAQIDRELEND